MLRPNKPYCVPLPLYLPAQGTTRSSIVRFGNQSPAPARSLRKPCQLRLHERPRQKLPESTLDRLNVAA
jgi:hypothetical protein